MAIFNAAFYLEANPDVAIAGLDAEFHFRDIGYLEGRDPNALFDTSYYLSTNPDVFEAGINPLTHFEDNGWKEGRNPHPYFDISYYLDQNPDVAVADVNPLEHYLSYGGVENRLATPLFDPVYYLQQNPDIATAGIDPLVHYIRFGQNEGRLPRNPNTEPQSLAANLASTDTFQIAGNNLDTVTTEINAQTYFTVTGVENSDTFELLDTAGYRGAEGDGHTGGTTFSFSLLSGTANTVNLSLTGAADIIGGRGSSGSTTVNAGDGGVAVSAPGVFVMLISSTGSSANSILGGAGGTGGPGGDGAAGQSIVLGEGAIMEISGTQDLNLGAVNSFDVNATNFSGKLSVIVNSIDGSGSRFIAGGSDNDVIGGGAGDDRLIGNGGNDTFVMSAGAFSTSIELDSISDFVNGSDILRSVNTTVAADQESPTLNLTIVNGKITAFVDSSLTTAQQKIDYIDRTNADSQQLATDTAVFFEHGGNTYIFFENAQETVVGNTDSQVVQLTGVTGLNTMAINTSSGDLSFG